MTTQVTVIARLTARSGMEERVRQELLKIIAPTRAEEGCINYDLHQMADDQRRFVFYENWTSKEALESHTQTSHYKDLEAVAREMATEPLEVSLLLMISTHAQR